MSTVDPRVQEVILQAILYKDIHGFMYLRRLASLCECHGIKVSINNAIHDSVEVGIEAIRDLTEREICVLIGEIGLLSA